MKRAAFLISFIFVLCCRIYNADAQGIITTIAGDSITQYIGVGSPATAYSLAQPVAVCADKKGKVYVANYADNLIMTVYRDTLKTIVGDTSGSSDAGDGYRADSALLRNPDGLCLDTAGNLYISEWYNDVIRKVDVHTGIITTICGISGGGFGGDGFPATLALLNHPHGICTDIAGNVYVADYNNQRIRKITVATGLISTVAGSGTTGYDGDFGAATAASLSYPNSVCTDTSGNIYFAETGNHTIRRIDAATGIITTVAGTGTAGYSVNGTPATTAQLSEPNAVYADKYGYIYISDYGNNIVRAITPGGLIFTIAGNGYYGYSGDGGPPLGASFRGPTAVCTDDSGYIYIADGMNSVIRKMSPVIQLNVGVKDITRPAFDIFPNPSSGRFTITPGQAGTANVYIINTLGQCVCNVTAKGTSSLDLSCYPPGVYYIKYVTQHGEAIQKLVIY